MLTIIDLPALGGQLMIRRGVSVPSLMPCKCWHMAAKCMPGSHFVSGSRTRHAFSTKYAKSLLHFSASAAASFSRSCSNCCLGVATRIFIDFFIAMVCEGMRANSLTFLGST